MLNCYNRPTLNKICLGLSCSVIMCKVFWNTSENFWNNYSPHPLPDRSPHTHTPIASVTDMQDKFGWRSLERRTDSRLIMGVQNYTWLCLAIPLPLYFQQPTRTTRHSHHIALRQIHTSFNFCKYFFLINDCCAVE